MKHSLYEGNSVNLYLKPFHKMMGKNKKVGNKKKIKVTNKSNVIDYDKDPFFIKKDEESVKFLKKHGFPEEYEKMRRM